MTSSLSPGRRVAMIERIISDVVDLNQSETRILVQMRQSLLGSGIYAPGRSDWLVINSLKRLCREREIDPDYGRFLYIDTGTVIDGKTPTILHRHHGDIALERDLLEELVDFIPQKEGDVAVLTPDQIRKAMAIE